MSFKYTVLVYGSLVFLTAVGVAYHWPNLPSVSQVHDAQAAIHGQLQTTIGSSSR